jgi:hypothetical protein
MIMVLRLKYSYRHYINDLSVTGAATYDDGPQVKVLIPSLY